jgi:AAA+ ATPase superfamily predicted ATPase
MFPNISELEEVDIDGVYNYSIKPFINEYVSFIFEDICVQYMRNLNKNLQLPFRFSSIGRWWDKLTEIDLVAFDTIGNLICGECKWKNSKIGIKELNQLKEKSISIEGHYQNKYYYLFSKSGFNEDLVKLSFIDTSIKLISINDIYYSLEY